MEKPDSIKQKEADTAVRKQVLEILKTLKDETDDCFVKKACETIAKDIIEVSTLRLKLELSHKELEEDYEAMYN